MIDIINLSKHFGAKVALQGVSFSIKKGEIVGLIGPNGSGKTTLLNVLMGMIKPTEGQCTLQTGMRMAMGVSRKGFFNDMNVRNNILMYSRLAGVDDTHAEKIMKDFDIDFGKVNFGKLSAGMKQRVSLAFAFIEKADFILLDEPSNHLDVDSILALRKMVIEGRRQGAAFLIASHIFSDLEKVSDRMLFLKSGMLVGDVDSQVLINEYSDLETAYLKIFKK